MEYLDDPKDNEIGPRLSWYCQQELTHEYCGGYECDCDCHEEPPKE